MYLSDSTLIVKLTVRCVYVEMSQGTMRGRTIFYCEIGSRR